MPDLSTPEGRLQAVVEDLMAFREEWEKQGSPALTKGSMGQKVPHPLIKLIRDAERAVHMLSQPAAARRGGRPAGASSAPDRKAKLRVA